MATYRVSGPGGSVYEFDAPDNATPEQLQNYVHTKVAPHHEQTTGEALHGVASSFLDGVLPGVAGVASGLANGAMHPTSFGDSFRSGRKAAERNEEGFKEAHPYLGAAATAAGFVGGLALPVTKVGLGARVASSALRGRVLNAAANGALYGAAGAAASSHADGATGVAREAARGAVMGSAAGAVLPFAGRIAGVAAAPVISRVAAVAAPAVGAAGRAIGGSAGRHLENRAASAGMSPAEAQASRYVGRQMDQAGFDSAGLLTELQRRQAMGVPAVPADVSEHLRSAYGSAARRPGPAVVAVRRAIDERQRQQTARVVQHLQETLGPTANVEAHAEQLNEQARRDAAPLYDLSNAQPIPAVLELQELFSRPAGRQALQNAGFNLANEGVNPATVGLVEGADGTFRLGTAPTMPAYDYAKTSLDHSIYAGQSPLAQPEVTRDMRGAIAIRRRLLEIMDGDGSGPMIHQPGTDIAPKSAVAGPVAPEAPQLPSQALGLPAPPPSVRGQPSKALAAPQEAVDRGQVLHPEALAPEAASEAATPSLIPPNGLNPYWKPAREAYAGPVQNRKALVLGEEMARDDATDAGNRMAEMSGSQVEHFRLGHRSGMVKDLQKLGDYGNAGRKVDGSRAKREAIATVHGQERADPLFDRLAAEHEAHQTWAAVRGNSMTAERQVADQLAEQDQRLASAGKGIWALASGRPLDFARHAASALTNGPAGSAFLNDRVAQQLGSQDLATVREMTAGVRRTRVADRAAATRGIERDQQAAKDLGARSGAGGASPADTGEPWGNDAGGLQNQSAPADFLLPDPEAWH